MARQSRMSSLGKVAVAALAALIFFSVGTQGFAQVKPGDMITPENAIKVKDLVAPGVYYKVERGMTMKIVPSQRVDWPPPYKEATEKYAGQVRLTDDNRSLVGFVAGQPFPLIDVNDLPLDLLFPDRRGRLKEAEALPLKQATEEFEREIILRVLERVGWNQSEAARLLGVHRNSLKVKLERWGIRSARED